jgi:hypothetical protein
VEMRLALFGRAAYCVSYQFYFSSGKALFICNYNGKRQQMEAECDRNTFSNWVSNSVLRMYIIILSRSIVTRSFKAKAMVPYCVLWSQ